MVCSRGFTSFSPVGWARGCCWVVFDVCCTLRGSGCGGLQRVLVSPGRFTRRQRVERGIRGWVQSGYDDDDEGLFACSSRAYSKWATLQAAGFPAAHLQCLRNPATKPRGRLFFRVQACEVQALFPLQFWKWRRRRWRRSILLSCGGVGDIVRLGLGLDLWENPKIMMLCILF